MVVVVVVVNRLCVCVCLLACEVRALVCALL